MLHTDCEQTMPITPIEKATTIFIGPEGGFTDQELSWMAEQNCQSKTLGHWCLSGYRRSWLVQEHYRTETFVIALTISQRTVENQTIMGTIFY